MGGARSGQDDAFDNKFLYALAILDTTLLKEGVTVALSGHVCVWEVVFPSPVLNYVLLTTHGQGYGI